MPKVKPKPKEVEVRAVRESEGDMLWCSAEEAHEFAVYEGEPGSFAWIAGFADNHDAVYFAQARAMRLGATFCNRIGEF